MTNPHHRLEERFTHHPPQGDQAKRYEEIRTMGRQFAQGLIDRAIVSSPELTLAINAVDQAVMWANAAIARNGV